MSESSQASSPSSFFNLHVEGVGYLNRVRTVKPKKGQEFLACTVAALRGSDSDVSYTKFDCRVSGADAQAIVKRLENETKTASGIVIPDNAAEKPDQGEVMAVGPGKRNDKGDFVALNVKVGDRVLFGKYSGQTVKVDGDELLVMREEDLFAVVEK